MLNDYLNLSTTEFAKILSKKVEIEFLLNSKENIAIGKIIRIQQSANPELPFALTFENLDKSTINIRIEKIINIKFIE